MVSLTLMLVIVTIVSAIQLQLPATPYLKVDSRWNIFLALSIKHNDNECSLSNNPCCVLTLPSF